MFTYDLGKIKAARKEVFWEKASGDGGRSTVSGADGWNIKIEDTKLTWSEKQAANAAQGGERYAMGDHLAELLDRAAEAYTAPIRDPDEYALGIAQGFAVDGFVSDLKTADSVAKQVSTEYKIVRGVWDAVWGKPDTSIQDSIDTAEAVISGAKMLAKGSRRRKTARTGCCWAPRRRARNCWRPGRAATTRR